MHHYIYAPHTSFEMKILQTITWILLEFLGVVATVVQIILWLPSYIYRSLVILYVGKFRPDLAKILDTFPTLLNDNFTRNPANCSIVATLAIEGDITLQSLQKIFKRNVLEAAIQNNMETLRYPQLKQYQVDFMGYRFWKYDPKFLLNNHIRETTFNFKISSLSDKMFLSELHTKTLNKVYPDNRSPWEMLLLRTLGKSIIILRMHHSMADGKSILKLIVECLGQKQLKTAAPSCCNKRRTNSAAFNFILLPYSIFRVNRAFLKSQLETWNNSWRVKDVFNDSSPFNVCFSRKLSIHEMKLLARRHEVSVSAVIISTLFGAIQKWQGFKGSGTMRNFPLYCILPKEDHPPVFTNHYLLGMLNLTDGNHNVLERLHLFNESYKKSRSSQLSPYITILSDLVSTWPGPLRNKLTPLRAVTTVYSNIAGEEDGFSILDFPCSDFTMSATYRISSIGLGFTVFSYKDHLQVAVVTKSSVIGKMATEEIAAYIAVELNDMLENFK